MSSDDGGFYLIAKCKGFYNQNISNGEHKRVEPEATLLRDDFWRLTSFSERRELELEKRLYIKTLFVLSTPIQSPLSDKSKGYLCMLVCDQVTLFKDTDDAFRSSQVSRECLLTQNKYLTKQEYKNRAQELCINHISRELTRKETQHTKCSPATGQKDRIDLVQTAIELLRAVIQYATKEENSSVYTWLFSDRHIKITPDNIDDYRKHFSYWRKQRDYTDGKSEDKAFADFLGNKSEIQKLVKLRKENKNPYEYWMLDLRSCIDDFHTIFPESKSLITTIPQCEWFIRNVLAEYISSYTRETETLFQKPSEYRSLNLGVPSFKKRMDRWEKLECKFLSDRTYHLAVREGNEKIYWGIDTTLEGTSKQHVVEQLAEQICQFFQMLYPDREFPPKKNRTSLYLQRRIAWVIRYHKKIIADKPEETGTLNMTPILLLNMVLQLAYTVWEDVGESKSDYSKEEIHIKQFTQRTFFSRIGEAKQRLAQLNLLKKMSDTLNLPIKDQMENYREFLLKQGIEMLSREEMLFWRKLLHKKYELLPLIGFQLCYINYARESLPYHFQTLACKISSSWRTKYHEYYVAHRKELKRDALDKKELYQEAKKKYKKLWKDASIRTDEMLEFLEQECKRINDIDSMTPEEQSYQCPILETKLRMLLREEALQKLFDGFCNVYGYSLHYALTYQCNLTLSQGEIPTKREESIPPQ